MNHNPHDRYISLQQMADKYGLSVKSCRRMVATGALPAFRIGERVIRVRERDVEALMQPVPTTDGAA